MTFNKLPPFPVRMALTTLAQPSKDFQAPFHCCQLRLVSVLLGKPYSLSVKIHFLRRSMDFLLSTPLHCVVYCTGWVNQHPQQTPE